MSLASDISDREAIAIEANLKANATPGKAVATATDRVNAALKLHGDLGAHPVDFEIAVERIASGELYQNTEAYWGQVDKMLKANPAFATAVSDYIDASYGIATDPSASQNMTSALGMIGTETEAANLAGLGVQKDALISGARTEPLHVEVVAVGTHGGVPDHVVLRNEEIEQENALEARVNKEIAQAGNTQTSQSQSTQVASGADTKVEVKDGDSLSAIAERMLGDASRWSEIYEANKELIGENPDLIHPGMDLVIPGKQKNTQLASLESNNVNTTQNTEMAQFLEGNESILEPFKDRGIVDANRHEKVSQDVDLGVQISAQILGNMQGGRLDIRLG